MALSKNWTSKKVQDILRVLVNEIAPNKMQDLSLIDLININTQDLVEMLSGSNIPEYGEKSLLFNGKNFKNGVYQYNATGTKLEYVGGFFPASTDLNKYIVLFYDSTSTTDAPTLLNLDFLDDAPSGTSYAGVGMLNTVSSASNYIKLSQYLAITGGLVNSRIYSIDFIPIDSLVITSFGTTISITKKASPPVMTYDIINNKITYTGTLTAVTNDIMWSPNGFLFKVTGSGAGYYNVQVLGMVDKYFSSIYQRFPTIDLPQLWVWNGRITQESIYSISAISLDRTIKLTNLKSDGTEEVIIETKDIEFDNLRNIGQKAKNHYFFQFGDYIRIYSGTDASSLGQVNLYYYRQPNLVVNDTDYVDVSDKYIPLLIAKCKNMIYELIQLQPPESLTNFISQKTAEIRAVINEENGLIKQKRTTNANV